MGGERFIDHMDETSPDPIRLGGIAAWVAGEVERRTGLDARSMVLGHIQRGGTPTPHDRLLATRFGFEAFELLQRQDFNRLVVMQEGRLSAVPIVDVANKVRQVPADNSVLRAARALGTSFGD